MELCKPALNQKEDPALRRSTQTTLVRVLEAALRLLHPIMPFITEEIWQKLPEDVRAHGSGVRKESIMISPFPVANEKLLNRDAESDMHAVMDLILAVRNIRGEMNIAPSVQIKALVKTETKDLADHLEQNVSYVKTLGRLSDIRIGTAETKPKGAATGVIKGAEVYVPLEGVIDLGQERDRLLKEIAKISKDIEVFSKKLSNKNFVDKAPREVVEKDTAKLEEFRVKREKLEQSLKMLG